MRRILAAMSGGVDSAAACLLLKQQGYEVGGATMLLRDGGEVEAEDARRAAEQMGIGFHLFDLRREFQEKVIDEFTRVYQSGGTPNPCVVCNRTMKFGMFLEKALALGYDGIATGHYARMEEKNGRYVLRTARDRVKDQTYMLCGLSQWQLAHTLFPLGTVESKAEIRALAEQAGLELSHKHDSQDICFVPDGDYAKFIEKYTGKKTPEGDFVDKDGNYIGRHKGIIHYTIGQRRGLGIPAASRLYVCEISPKTNTVVLGDNEDLFSSELEADNVNLISVDSLTEPKRVTAKIRYRHKEQPATAWQTPDGILHVKFDEPQRAITKGQAVVMYDGDEVVGGGVINKIYSQS